MADTIESIKKRMNELEILIRETRDRLPAHSVKPPVMMDLLEYEDEYDALLEKLKPLQREMNHNE
jgi:hypothetical protein